MAESEKYYCQKCGQPLNLIAQLTKDIKDKNKHIVRIKQERARKINQLERRMAEDKNMTELYYRKVIRLERELADIKSLIMNKELDSNTKIKYLKERYD